MKQSNTRKKFLYSKIIKSIIFFRDYKKMNKHKKLIVFVHKPKDIFMNASK